MFALRQHLFSACSAALREAILHLVLAHTYLRTQCRGLAQRRGERRGPENLTPSALKNPHGCFEEASLLCTRTPRFPPSRNRHKLNSSGRSISSGRPFAIRVIPSFI